MWVCDLVYVDTANIAIPRFADRRKLQYPFMGPFPVQEVVAPDVYHLTLPPGLQVYPRWHVSKLRACIGKTDGKVEPFGADAPGTLADDECVVEKVLNHQKVDGELYLQTKWRGDDYLTWEPLNFMYEEGRVTAAALRYLRRTFPHDVDEMVRTGIAE